MTLDHRPAVAAACRRSKSDIGETEVRPLVDSDRAWAAAQLEAAWGSTSVARLGEPIDAAQLPGFVAHHAGQPVGLLTFVVRPDGVEIVTIQAEPEGLGAGRALLTGLVEHAHSIGADRVWLVTTNDNQRALDLYQRFGMSISRVVVDGVRRSRAVKPTIPMHGPTGIPITDEIVLQHVLGIRQPPR